jgi:hypothetical protein
VPWLARLLRTAPARQEVEAATAAVVNARATMTHQIQCAQLLARLRPTCDALATPHSPMIPLVQQLTQWRRLTTAMIELGGPNAGSPTAPQLR